MPIKKEDTKASSTRKSSAKTTTRKTSTTSPVTKQVASNARHIEENHQIAKNNSKLIHLLYGAVIILMMIIAGLAFYIGQNMGKHNTLVNSGATNTIKMEDVVVKIIDDKRCHSCQTNIIEEKIKALPFLAQATFEKVDFSEDGVAEYLKENNIGFLPAIVFNTNQLADGGNITPYLQVLPSKEFSLALGATFNPFAKRSEEGFLVVGEDVIQAVKNDAHYEGKENAKITWIEYTDVNCHYCKKMAQDETAKKVLEKFPEILNKTSSNFIGVGGPRSQKAAEILECAAKTSGSQLYTALLSEVLIKGDNSEATMLTYVSENGGNKKSVKACLDNGEAKEIVARKFERGQTVFGITGTPGNVILNNETGEYEIISGAYPTEKFIEVIEKLSK